MLVADAELKPIYLAGAPRRAASHERTKPSKIAARFLLRTFPILARDLRDIEDCGRFIYAYGKTLTMKKS